MIVPVLANIDNIIDDLSSGEGFSITGLFHSIGSGIMDVIKGLVGVLRDGVVFLHQVNQIISDTTSTIHELTLTNTIEGVNINTYMGNFRFATGDIVYLQIYSIIMIGIFFLLFMLLGKFVGIIRLLVHNVLHLNVAGGSDNLLMRMFYKWIG